MYKTGLAVWMLAACAFAQVKPEDILKSPNADWLTYAGDYRGTRHSPLKQITTANVSSLVPKWVYHVPKATKLEASPLVYQGVMYVTAPNEVRALDARTGRLVWEWKDGRATRSDVSRGAGLLGDSVYVATSDCFLTALNRKTGALLWQKQYADTKKGVFCSSAPFAVKDRVLVGTAGGDTGMRGFVAAHNATTGEEMWKFYTVPAKGEKGAETWGEYVEFGGAATWLSGTYDPELNTLYWTTGNPWPDFYDGDRKGDNLYSCSVVALDVDTGKLKWYFQFTPGDTHDWDGQSWPVLVDREVKGKMRKILLHPNRNGFYYVIDRVTGEFLHATKLNDLVDWASGIDAKGRPIKIPGKDPTPSGNRVCPGVRGGANWMAPTYNPATGMLYVITMEQCDIYTSSAKKPEPMTGFSGGGAGPKPRDAGTFYLRALDAATGKRMWEYPMPGPGVAWSGTVSTAGGVVFVGDDDGQLLALDAKSGKHLWHFQMGEYLFASPITYAVDGKQYVAIASATAVFSFGLFEPVPSVDLVKGAQ
jgi:alcohol dehydrogenase (cytochrome c)